MFVIFCLISDYQFLKRNFFPIAKKVLSLNILFDHIQIVTVTLILSLNVLVYYEFFTICHLYHWKISNKKGLFHNTGTSFLLKSQSLYYFSGHVSRLYGPNQEHDLSLWPWYLSVMRGPHGRMSNLSQARRKANTALLTLFYSCTFCVVFKEYRISLHNLFHASYLFSNYVFIAANI